MTNFAIEFPTGNFVFLSANALHYNLPEESQRTVNNSHIYFIVDVPKATIDPNSLSVSEISNKEVKMTMDLLYRFNGSQKRVPVGSQFDKPLELLENEVSVRISDYPHIALEILDSNKHVSRAINANEIGFYFQVEDLIEYKVLYVGQAFGNAANRNSMDRIRNHSTLQKILAESNATKPDRNVLIGMFEFGNAHFVTASNPNDESAISGLEDYQRTMNTLNWKIPLKQQISIIEAAIIRFFEPEYNISLKDNLPSKNSKTLAECYKYEISNIVVNVATMFDNFWGIRNLLYSEKVPKNSWHVISIALHDANERKNFFSIGDQMFEPRGVLRHK
ncbi:hypothetical protein [Acinetobacter sp. P8-3-8]|uniref:hypothetical protein n=1 Tax=Acinetobacter sp. P8-3-8 TaxID=1029823 RepID=UPI00110F9EFE|nr:hypothetical protein [Acinetobacter sp. P8-3-8]